MNTWRKEILISFPEIDRSAIAALIEGRHGDPFSLLGPHRASAGLSIRTFHPGAERAEILSMGGDEVLAQMERLEAGFFAALLEGQDPGLAYRIRFYAGDQSWTVDDPYRFPPILGELDLHLFSEGNHRRLYEKMGAHPTTIDGVQGTTFAVWAPNAQRVSVVGSFNEWDGRRHVMRKRVESGVWEIFLPGIGPGEYYKYEILSHEGRLLPLKSDPFAFSQEVPPSTASRVTGLPDRQWHDEHWMQTRRARNDRAQPISIYEVHLGSWRRGDGNAYLDYDELADQLIPYVKDMGFTHIELLPVSEHPFSGSWGYQPIGLYAPTSRFGSPEAFGRFVERCHAEGIGLIIDWVPAHFPTDEHGLARFDGTALYEHADPRQGFHRDWNTLIYNFGRREVRNFLEANALYWMDEFHIDGLRVDAVASMLYLDYSREPGDWVPNVHGGRENLEAISFLRDTNTNVFGGFEGATTFAEESTAWPGVSRPVETGGLGFGYKWNMGWMHDTLAYIHNDPVHRRYHHHQMTFGLLYAFSENFVLPISHDEVVHGKGSLLGKMPGDEWQRFANLRAYFGFMWTHPGKKLIFMGCEFAQEREWNHDQSLDWHLLGGEGHAGMQRLVRDLNHLYRDLPALHQRDCEPAGFQWIDASDADQSVFSYLRRGERGEDVVAVICNFTPVVRHGYRVGLPFQGRWEECLNTDAGVYGGSNVGNDGEVRAEDVGWHGQPASAALTLPPLGVIVLRYQP
ncbi:1,4-alpha-glucan branching protein GlgB [Afifella sp. JA880]|uniref:1,4-alpha-glucan branching protein GlgB n=1 Tax=Afifella sp. JA880 TaxID=2975280 RepID=UPI0021BA3CB9|nr:1,4-alpha-glucan branching protein GlgB [Afifella sp. JA880]MCT8268835.1 1,4-alpha-glucan branching protein GlgB [Afifella sp. JA880]